MTEEDSYFAGMEVGETRTTEGRTITEADVVNQDGDTVIACQFLSMLE